VSQAGRTEGDENAPAQGTGRRSRSVLPARAAPALRRCSVAYAYATTSGLRWNCG